LKQTRIARETGTRRGGHHHYDEIGQRVQRHRDQAERDELERDVAGRIDELRNEGQKERRGLRVQGFDQHAFPKHALCTDSDDLLRQQIARLAKRLEAKPDQIERAREFERGEQLGTGKDERRDANRAPDDMHEPAERSPEC
jgi:hypothetical protein